MAASLCLTEEHLRLTERLSGIGTFSLDLQTGRWTASPRAAALFGLAPLSATHDRAAWEEAVGPEDRAALRDAIDRADQTDGFDICVRVPSGNAGERLLSVRGAVSPDGRRLHGVCNEVDQVGPPQAQPTDETKLHESERPLRLLIESVTDYAIYMLDMHGNVVNWNPGAERLKGYTSEQILGQHFSRFYTAEDRERGLPARVLEQAITGGKYEGEGWRVRQDGTRFWASVVVHPIHDSGNELVGFAKVTRDLTERRAAEERLRQSQKMEAVGQLTGGIAHDFNNLLTVISGNLETLQRRLSARADEGLQRYITSALHGASRAALLTHQLLAFSRRQALDPKSISVNRLISQMSELLRRTLPETIAIETVLAGGLWDTFADVNQLENALLNLALNARDAMPDGGKLTIEAANVYFDDRYAAGADVPPGQYVGLFVSDTGTGMSPEVAAKAFDPFFTTKEAGRGTGLGLSQVYGFVRQSGGHVRIYSELGAGTTIKIYLPRLFTPAPRTLEPAAPEETIPHGAGETVLVVEDESAVRGFAVDLLQELGYKALEAPDAASGLMLLDAHPETVLLLTDVGLPGGMNGRQLADAALRRRPDLKVLFASGYARNAIVHHGRLDPDVQLIPKPFTFAGLATKVRQVLDSL